MLYFRMVSLYGYYDVYRVKNVALNQYIFEICLLTFRKKKIKPDLKHEPESLAYCIIRPNIRFKSDILWQCSVYCLRILRREQPSSPAIIDQMCYRWYGQMIRNRPFGTMTILMFFIIFLPFYVYLWDLCFLILSRP